MKTLARVIAGATLILSGIAAGSAKGATALPVLWTAEGSTRAPQARARQPG